MRREVFIFLMIIVVVCAQDTAMERKKKYYGIPAFLYKGGIMTFIAFVAIKAKIIIAITVAVTVFTLGMKAFAALKYGKEFFSCHHDGVVLSHPPVGYSHDFSSSGPVEYSAYSSDSSYGPPHTPHSDSSYEKFGRKFDNMFEQDWSGLIKKVMKRLDLTDFAFDSMNIKNDTCKRRLVCEMDIYSRKNSLLGFGLLLFSDQGLNKYRNETNNAKSIKECSDFYSECPS